LLAARRGSWVRACSIAQPNPGSARSIISSFAVSEMRNVLIGLTPKTPIGAEHAYEDGGL